jgi:hypothetical protein
MASASPPPHIDAAFLEAVIDIGLDGARRSSSKRQSA